MGFSMVSLIEIIYFLSLRPYCAYRRVTHTDSRSSATEPSYLQGVYDPKKLDTNTIITVRPISYIRDQKPLQRSMFSPEIINNDTSNSSNIWTQIKHQFINEPKVKRNGDKQYPYTE